jgi:GTP-binding protein HflX
MRGPLPSAWRRRALLVALVAGRERTGRGQPLEELRRLADTAGAEVVGEVLQVRDRPEPATLVGSGKVEEIAAMVRDRHSNLVIFDNDLSPTQLRNLEDRLKTVVMDRTEIILDIFAIHARSREAKLQVKLVQMKYMLPRLVGRRKSMEQFQATAAVGGGVAAGRGPGEKQIEYDRRVLRDRIHDLQTEIKEVQKRRERMVRRRAEMNFTVSFVGYTNAGKSTLMRRLTGADVGVRDELFSTLDTKTATWELENGLKVLLSDTVGFIEDLPNDLVTAFYATLEEVREADILLHVADASSPHLDRHLGAVEQVLERIDCAATPQILLLNKIDRVAEPVERTILAERHPGAVLISAATGEGVDALERRLDEMISDRVVDATLRIPVTEGRLIAEVLRDFAVRRQASENEHMLIEARIPRRDFYRFERYVRG